MASGGIVGDCWVCGELVWEDEWDEEWFMAHGEFIHEKCRDTANHLSQTTRQIKKEIIELKKLVLSCQREIKRLRESIERLINIHSKEKKENHGKASFRGTGEGA